MKSLFILLFFISLLFSLSFQEELQEGVRYYKAKQYERAFEIFDKLLIQYPNNKRVRLEYARVLYRLGMYDESKREFLKVLNTNLPPIVQKNIKYFIKLIEKKQKTNFFNGSLAIGATRDTNIENKSDNPIYAGFIDSNTTKRKDNFLTQELMLSYTKKFSKSFWINSIYLYNEQDHQNSSDRISFASFNTTYQLPLFGLRISMPFGYDITFLDGEKFSRTFKVRPKMEKITNFSISSIAMLYEDIKNFSDDERSYKSYGIRAGYLWFFKRFKNIIGLNIKRYKAKKDNRLDVSKQRVSLDMSSSYPLSETNLISLFFKKTQDKYTKKDPTIQDNRRDSLNSFSFSLNQEITKHNSFELSISKIKNSSNLDFYSYDKSVFSIKLRNTF